MIGRCKGSVPDSLKQAYYNLGSLAALVCVYICFPVNSWIIQEEYLSIAQGFMSTGTLYVQEAGKHF